MRLFLLSARYDNKIFKVIQIFYNPKTDRLVVIPDTKGHKPYCLVRPEYEKQLELAINTEDKYKVSSVTVTDPIADEKVSMLKVSAPDPLSIGGGKNSLREKVVTWESDIKYYERYLFDTQRICGLWYDVDEKSNNVIPFDDPSTDFSEVKKRLKMGNEATSEYDEFLLEWVRLLNQPIPEIKRLAVDIEVEFEGSVIPSVAKPDKKITAIGFSSNDGFRKVYVLGNGINNETIKFYQDEKQMLLDSFKLFTKFPFIITFNGDAFDLPYMYARSERLEIPYESIPLTIKSTRISDGAYTDPVYVKDAIHLDLYRFFKNKSIQNYAFSHKYAEYSLDAIAKGLLNEAKITYQGSLNDMSPEKLAEYCLNDADLTIKLTTFNDNMLIKLIIMICRIAKQPIDDVTRYGINQWGRGMFYSEMIKNRILIPRGDELLSKGLSASTKAVIKDKKYQGAFVFEPIKGVYFNVKSLDFSSLYPSIIKSNNISFETINCAHQDCINNTVPETQSWACDKKLGLASMIIGSLRDLRVGYYKYMAKKKGLSDEEHQFFDIVAQTLKVIMNASYGIMGFEQFSLYCLPVAEAVTAHGRNVITKTNDHSKLLGLNSIYGDTDSLYFYNPNIDKMQELIQWVNKKFKIDLETDKSYRYLILTDLKKNYLGITEDGKPDVKGLTGKKSHTPVFIRELFFEILDILSKVQKEDEIPQIRENISKLIKKRVMELRANMIPFSKLAYNVVVSKDPNNYGIKKAAYKNLDSDYEKKDYKLSRDYIALPQHIKAAKMLPNIEAGSVVSLIKTKGKDGVKPKQLVKSVDEINVDKYIELMDSTFNQILSSFKLDFKDLIEGKKQMTMDDIFNIVVLKEEKI